VTEFLDVDDLLAAVEAALARSPEVCDWDLR